MASFCVAHTASTDGMPVGIPSLSETRAATLTGASLVDVITKSALFLAGERFHSFDVERARKR